MFFYELKAEEIEQFKKWARENFKPGDHIKETWHPIVRAECKRLQKEADLKQMQTQSFLRRGEDGEEWTPGGPEGRGGRGRR